MLTLQIPDGSEYYDDESSEFIQPKGGIFRFEHSLKTIARWEAEFKKPFLKDGNKTETEIQEYVLMMCLDDGLTREHLTGELGEIIANYMNDSQTATVITKEQTGGPGATITSEVLYAYMVIAEIPIECENWHVNRLLTLLEVVSDMKSEKKKMTPAEIREQNSKLNEERKKRLNTKG